MKVLLLGDFSSLHKFLKEGLQELGNIQVKLASNGDGWKKIGGADRILFDKSGRGLRKKYQVLVEPYITAKEFSGYDVVQLINTRLYSTLINKNIVTQIAKRNNCVSLCACGEDYALQKTYMKKKLEYYMYDCDKAPLMTYNPKTLKGILNIKNDIRIERISDVIIPNMYEYRIGYQGDKVYDVVPFPINVSSIKYSENIVKDKMIFFHGLNRELSKGTPFIKEAMLRLKQNYPNDVEVILEGHLPYKEYIEIMNKANVVIDQCLAYGYGINACIAMAQGKIVMSGNRVETRKAFGIENSPVIHIQPDVDEIYKQLVYVLEQKKNTKDMGYTSRRYVEDIHDHIKVAQRYVDAWKSTGKI